MREEIVSMRQELLRLNRVSGGALYLQVSRGVAPRNHMIRGDMQSSVVMTVGPLRGVTADVIEGRADYHGARYSMAAAGYQVGCAIAQRLGERRCCSAECLRGLAGE